MGIMFRLYVIYVIQQNGIGLCPTSFPIVIWYRKNLEWGEG